MSFVLVRNRSRLGHKPDYRLGWSSEYVRKSMYACRSVSVACRPAEKRRRRGEIGSIYRSILVGHRRPNRRQRAKPPQCGTCELENIMQILSKAIDRYMVTITGLRFYQVHEMMECLSLISNNKNTKPTYQQLY